jgi:hypothetical protein
MTKFRELTIGSTFDFVDDANLHHNSYYQRCVKTGTRTYESLEAVPSKMHVGSIDAQVFHVTFA